MDSSGKGRKSRGRSPESLAAKILDTAIELAEESGWGRLRLRDVAARLNVSLADIQRHYRDKDAIADAWFARAWQAMLAPTPPDFADLPAETRLYRLIMGWFDALAPHREMTRQMISEKLTPAHPHHWVPMIFNLSRTIQWLRDAAILDAGGRRRQIEEAGLSGLFLATLWVWCNDRSPQQSRTREYLARRLATADRAVTRLWGKAARAADDAA